jgi:predicted RNA-binding Zn-ribbon protein involved in translation (DUF1610 family)
MTIFTCKCGARYTHEFYKTDNKFRCPKCGSLIIRYYDQKEENYDYEVVENDR